MTDPLTVHRTHDEPSPGPSCFTVTTEKSLHPSSYIYFVSFLVVLFAPSRTNIDSLHVLSIMAPNKIEFMHVGDQSLSPRLPALSLALMMNVTPST